MTDLPDDFEYDGVDIDLERTAEYLRGHADGYNEALDDLLTGNITINDITPQTKS